MKHNTDVQLRRIKEALDKSGAKSPLPLDLKLRMAAIVLRLSERRKKHKRFGLFIILGWKNAWRSYADTPDISQDIFAQRRINIMEAPRQRLQNGGIVKTVDFDGAILIDPRGNVLHSGAMIEGLRPRATARKLNPRRAPDLSAQFGFRRKVHMRHIAAITSSYIFKGTTVYTISEESDDMHIFENGRIVYSTVRGEIHDPS